MSDHAYPKEAVRTVLALLDSTETDPTSLRAVWASDGLPNVHLMFDSLTAISAFAAADKVQLKSSDSSRYDSVVVDHYALYERPGRSMLIQFIKTGS